MQYIHCVPTAPAFKERGLTGYAFGPLARKDLDLYYIEVEGGHDTFMISKKITRIHYILSGAGHFIIDGRRYDVTSGMVVEVPPKVEYPTQAVCAWSRSACRDGGLETTGTPNGMRMPSALGSVHRCRMARGVAGYCGGGSSGNQPSLPFWLPVGGQASGKLRAAARWKVNTKPH